MTRLIIFLIRKKLGVKKYENFQFINQHSEATYYFTDINVMKNWRGIITPSNVSLNWLLDNDCEVRRKEV